MILYEFKCETFSSIEMKLSTLNSNKSPSFYDQPSADIIKGPLLESPEKYFYISELTKHLSSKNLLGNTLLQIQKWWNVVFLTSANIYQQTRAGQYTDLSEQKITISLPFSFQHPHILNVPQHRKTINYSQEHLYFIVLKVTPFPHQNY